MSKLLFIALVMMSGLAFSRPALAHVLVTDANKQIGTVLHVYPDDDPIAGEASSLFFYVQSDDYKQPDYNPQLVIKNPDGSSSNIGISKDGSTISADYVFPTTGVYMINLYIDSGGKQTVFASQQRVSRASSEATLEAQSHSLAEFALVLSASAFLALIIVAFNRRQQIENFSRF
jgi:hypothetical protein